MSQILKMCWKSKKVNFCLILGTYCDFEEDDQLCGWTQDQTDDSDWYWFSNNEQPGYKGPITDHTTGTNYGKWLPFINYL